MSLADLADLAKLSIPKPRGRVRTDGLWTSRSPILLPPSPIPGQHDVPTSTKPPSPIFPRQLFGLCANQSGDVYLHGGNTLVGAENDLWHYSIEDNTIIPLQCRGTIPSIRYGHAMTLVGNIIALYGGDTWDNDRALYLLNLVSHEWSKIITSGDAPEDLRQHAMATIGTTLYVFGGIGSTDVVSDELWAFDLGTLHTAEPRWELVKPSSQERPAARRAATLVSYQNQLIVFGGNSPGGKSDDVWSFDLRTGSWKKLQCTGDTPPWRTGHTAVVLDDVMYVIGGCQFIYFMRGDHLKDIFGLKIPEKRWFKLRDANIIPRYHHAGACIGTKIFIFGGELGEGSEEHPIHILDANYIGDSDLHTRKRLKEIDGQFQVMRNRGTLSNDSENIETSTRSQIILHILGHPSKMESLAKLQKADAQMTVDFLADELGYQDILKSNADKRHILHFLTKLAKSTQTFPTATELSDVQCSLTTPVNAKGGYGFIYKGVFRGQVVCVKAVHVAGSGTEAGSTEALREEKKLRAQAGEAVLLAHISHPNVIPLYGTYLSNEESSRICIVSPWMENGDLTTYLGKFPKNPKIPLAVDMAAGLGFLHDLGIIHADLKAANILVSRSQRAMLADFGIATVFHTNVGTTTSADFAGTTYWMAPELLVAAAERQPCPPTKESDMWGFACICYEMFTGGIPFLDRKYMPVSLMMAFVRGRRITPLRPDEESEPVDVDGDPINVDDEPWVPLAERCWNYEPSNRPTATEALQFLTDLNVQDDRPSMDEELSAFQDIKDSRAMVEIDYGRVLSIVRTT